MEKIPSTKLGESDSSISTSQTEKIITPQLELKSMLEAESTEILLNLGERKVSLLKADISNIKPKKLKNYADLFIKQLDIQLKTRNTVSLEENLMTCNNPFVSEIMLSSLRSPYPVDKELIFYTASYLKNTLTILELMLTRLKGSVLETKVQNISLDIKFILGTLSQDISSFTWKLQHNIFYQLKSIAGNLQDIKSLLKGICLPEKPSEALFATSIITETSSEELLSQLQRMGIYGAEGGESSLVSTVSILPEEKLTLLEKNIELIKNKPKSLLKNEDILFISSKLKLLNVDVAELNKKHHLSLVVWLKLIPSCKSIIEVTSMVLAYEDKLSKAQIEKALNIKESAINCESAANKILKNFNKASDAQKKRLMHLLNEITTSMNVLISEIKDETRHFKIKTNLIEVIYHQPIIIDAGSKLILSLSIKNNLEILRTALKNIHKISDEVLEVSLEKNTLHDENYIYWLIDKLIEEIKSLNKNIFLLSKIKNCELIPLIHERVNLLMLAFKENFGDETKICDILISNKNNNKNVKLVLKLLRLYLDSISVFAKSFD